MVTIYVLLINCYYSEYVWNYTSTDDPGDSYLYTSISTEESGLTNNT